MNRPVKVESHDPLVKSVAAALRDRCKVTSGARLLVAVSGGADSVALLRTLATLAPKNEWRLDLAVAHVQHHLREQAEQDAAFVHSLATSLKLPYFRADLDLKQTKGNLEGRARKERYEALSIMARAFGTPLIVTAHHGDDQLETLLMRMLRGASIQGLRGMAWRRQLFRSSDSSRNPKPDTRHPLLLRPMLAIDRPEILRYLRDLDQSWCEDHTNEDVTRLRARLRRDVLPVLRELKPDVVQRAAELSDHLRQASRVLTDAIESAADRVIVTGPVRTLDRTDARTLRRIVLAGLLRRLLLELGAKADRIGNRALSPLLRAIGDTTGGSRSFDFSGGVSVLVTRQVITLGRADPSIA